MAFKVPDVRKKRLLSMKYNQSCGFGGRISQPMQSYLCGFGAAALWLGVKFQWNQSQMQFKFTEEGTCGRRAKLWESLPKHQRDTIRKNNLDWTVEDPDGEHHLYWSEPPENVLVIKKFKDVQVTKKFMILTQWLVEEKHLTVTVEPSIFLEKEIKGNASFADVRDSFKTWEDRKGSQEEVLSEVDLVICVGGDGTLLYTSSMFQDKFPPIMSFHMGSLGFLTPFQFASSSDSQKDLSSGESADSYKMYIEKVLKGGVSLTLRHRLECKIKTADIVSVDSSDDICPLSPSEKPLQFAALLSAPDKAPWKKQDELHKEMLVMNDLVVDRGPNPYLTNLLIKCNGRSMTTVQGDGIIIATPTGSTAYSLAAGASMVHPSVPCIIVTPICPHSLSFRSIVVPSGVELEIMLNPASRTSAWVSFDGRNRQEIARGDSVVINTCKWPIPSINNTGHVTDWFDSLAECLNWNVRKEQKKLNTA